MDTEIKTSRDFTSADTVRNNSYMKKISNQKHQTIKKIEANIIPELRPYLNSFRNMDLNEFKKYYETSMQSNKPLAELLIASFVKTSNEYDTRQNDTNEISPSIENNDHGILTFAVLDDDSDQSNQGNTNSAQDNNTLETQSISQETNSTPNSIGVLPVDFRLKLNPTSINYQPRKRELKVLMRLAKAKSTRLITLIGTSGTGKTLLAKTISNYLNAPCVFVSCHRDMTGDDLQGSMQIIKNSSIYQLGSIAQAIICANDPNNKSKTCVLIFDEINTLTSEVQKLFNNNLEFEDGIEIPMIGRKFKLNDGCKIIPIATCNPAHYQGVNPFNSELLSRTKAIEIFDLTDSETKELVKTNYNRKTRSKMPDSSLYQQESKDIAKVSDQFLDQILHFKQKINAIFLDGDLDRGIDTREIVSFVDDYTTAINDGENEEQAVSDACHVNFYAKYVINGDQSQTRLILEELESAFGLSTTQIEHTILG